MKLKLSFLQESKFEYRCKYSKNVILGRNIEKGFCEATFLPLAHQHRILMHSFAFKFYIELFPNIGVG